MVNIEQLKKLRQETGLSISECKKALESAGGDIEKAKEILKKSHNEFFKKREERETKQGIIDSYIHPGKKIGAMIELHCESDFVARSADFQRLAHELCLQIAAMDPTESSFLEQPWIKDERKTVGDLIKEYIAKFGENIIVKKFVRYQI